MTEFSMITPLQIYCCERMFNICINLANLKARRLIVLRAMCASALSS